jgi:TRAP transporter TAXI family solute receptor
MTRPTSPRWSPIAGLLASLLSVATAGAADPPLTFVTLGTSESLYYDLGRAICKVIDKTRRDHGVRCSAEPTPGSVYNLERLADGDLDFALVQSDAQFAAYRGEGGWSALPFTELRSVMSLYPEAATLLVRADGGISALNDLRGKRINVGNPGSGTQATWNQLQSTLAWGAEDLGKITELRPDRAGEALCAGEIDASFLMVGHPSPLVKAAIGHCALWFTPIQGPEIDRLVADRPYYTKVVIPAALSGLSRDLPTFGARATLLTTASMPEEVVYTVTKAILSNLDALRAGHPVLSALVAEEMPRAALSAPLHPGAERAFREIGVIP